MARVSTIGMRKIEVQVLAAGTRVPISPIQLFVSDFEFHPKAANAGANMYIGDLTVNNTFIPRPKGVTVNFVHGTGIVIGEDSVVRYDLNKIFVDADANGDIGIVQFFDVDKPS